MTSAPLATLREWAGRSISVIPEVPPKLPSIWNGVSVEGADEVTLLISMGSGYRSFKDVGGDSAEVAGRHLEQASGRPYDALPTDERIARQPHADLPGTGRVHGLPARARPYWKYRAASCGSVSSR
ncbi:hypothetical protein B0I32_102683 [Nonomuraea fuscirosea]|uniref:Uncharacterized protein n=1 Tax=Nonomuraea fuscirosea TaxID=1291556 RepID=A0A2T0NA40_9ACTN|nr:hypothetical protein [Nonomuraea fuscirosea]PRX69625.1 hypothetical protein B0I32_102683 [Nonomuraea fuscirosea]